MIKRFYFTTIVVLMLTCIQFVVLAVNDDLALLLEKLQINMAEEKDEV